MSTQRRRPTGAVRRPQVAGRPRGAAAETEPPSPETTEGHLAIEERTEARTPTRPITGGRPRTAARPGARTDDDAGADGEDGTAAVDASSRAGEPDAEPDGDGARDGSTGDDAAGDDAMARAETGTDGGLPTAPVVRSGETGAADGERSGSGPAAWLRRVPRPQAPATRRGTAALLVVTILLTAAAVFFAVSAARLQFSGAAANTALSDVGTTATVSEQVGEAVTKVYSFDHARLDQAESDARAVITGPFVGQFDQIFGNVRQLAPRQQAVVTATIPKSAVQSIDGDRATVYVFVNQVVRRVDDGGQPQQGTAAARLRVDAVNVDGRWKVSGMTPA